jgi:hypothetical protein
LCSGYQPANKTEPVVVTELQPPDLWINYDRARSGNPDKCDEPDEETAMMSHASDSRDEMDPSKFYRRLYFLMAVDFSVLVMCGLRLEVHVKSMFELRELNSFEAQ